MLTSSDDETYAQCCEAIAAMDLRADLARISAPTLVIAGADDPATPPEHSRRIADGRHEYPIVSPESIRILGS